MTQTMETLIGSPLSTKLDIGDAKEVIFGDNGFSAIVSKLFEWDIYNGLSSNRELFQRDTPIALRSGLADISLSFVSHKQFPVLQYLGE
jgi:hypothetical protein